MSNPSRISRPEQPTTEDYRCIDVGIDVPDCLRPSCTAMIILSAERYILLVESGRELDVVDDYLRRLTEQGASETFLERFRRAALGWADVGYWDQQGRLWLPDELCRWVGSTLAARLDGDKQVRLTGVERAR